MDDGAQPKPRATTARTPKRTAPADPRTDGGVKKRTTGTRTAKPTVTTTTSPLMPTASIVDDPVLPPVDEGTPIEIPRIVPAEVDDDLDDVWGSAASTDTANGTAAVKQCSGPAHHFRTVDDQRINRYRVVITQ